MLCTRVVTEPHLSDEDLALPLGEVVVLGRGPGDEVAPRQVLGHQDGVEAGLVEARQPHHEGGLDEGPEDLGLAPHLALLLPQVLGGRHLARVPLPDEVDAAVGAGAHQHDVLVGLLVQLKVLGLGQGFLHHGHTSRSHFCNDLRIYKQGNGMMTAVTCNVTRVKCIVPPVQFSLISTSLEFTQTCHS